uniref:Lipopolysaccharide biosynthesis protein n=1 Tax=Desulfacinum infernum TaxID=35837 RepID=A0A831ZNB2_9BACT
MEGWQKELAKSGLWVLSISHSIKILAFFSTIILARLLGPSDFGIVAMATAVVTLVEMLGDFGFHVYLVQKQDLKDEDLNTAWTFQLVLALLEACALTVCAPFIARLYREPRLSPVFYALAATVTVGGFRNIGIISFQKELKFQREFFLRVPSKILAVSASLACAYATRNYWALIVGIFAQRLTEVAASYLLSSFRPAFSLRGTRELFRFSKWLYWNTTLSFLLQRSPDLILGKIAGKDAVGLFSVSHSLATLPTSELADPIARAAFPSYVKLKNDRSLLRDGYVKVLSLMGFFAIPLGVGIVALADILVPVLLGAQWSSAAPLLRILGVAGIVKTLQSNTGSIFLAQGRPQAVTALLILRVVVLVPMLVVLSSRTHAEGAAWAYLAAEAMIAPMVFCYVFKSFKIKWMSAMRIFLRPCVASLVMVLALNGTMASGMINGLLERSFGALTILVLVGFITYLCAAFGLWLVCGRENSTPESWIVGVLRRFSII